MHFLNEVITKVGRWKWKRESIALYTVLTLLVILFFYLSLRWVMGVHEERSILQRIDYPAIEKGTTRVKEEGQVRESVHPGPRVNPGSPLVRRVIALDVDTGSMDIDVSLYEGGSRKNIYDPFLRHRDLHGYRFEGEGINLEHLSNKDDYYLPPGDLDQQIQDLENAPYTGDTEVRVTGLTKPIDTSSSAVKEMRAWLDEVDNALNRLRDRVALDVESKQDISKDPILKEYEKKLGEIYLREKKTYDAFKEYASSGEGQKDNATITELEKRYQSNANPKKASSNYAQITKLYESFSKKGANPTELLQKMKEVALPAPTPGSEDAEEMMKGSALEAIQEDAGYSKQFYDTATQNVIPFFNYVFDMKMLNQPTKEKASQMMSEIAGDVKDWTEIYNDRKNNYTENIDIFSKIVPPSQPSAVETMKGQKKKKKKSGSTNKKGPEDEDEEDDKVPIPKIRTPSLPVLPTPVPSTPVPSTPVPTGPVPSTPVPTGPVPTGPVPQTSGAPIPTGQVPPTPVPPTPVPTGPTPPTPTKPVSKADPNVYMTYPTDEPASGDFVPSVMCLSRLTNDEQEQLKSAFVQGVIDNRQMGSFELDRANMDIVYEYFMKIYDTIMKKKAKEAKEILYGKREYKKGMKGQLIYTSPGPADSCTFAIEYENSLDNTKKRIPLKTLLPGFVDLTPPTPSKDEILSGLNE